MPLVRAVAGDGLMETDGELLRLFTRHGDTAAFDKLVERHAAMVWRVCRQTLRRQQDAEDAFQATFLLLVKSARQIGASESAAGWLFRVAYRTSLRARKRLASRREEALALDPTAPSEIPFPDLTTRQHMGVLAEELMELPLRYQTPLVMRYIEGQSRRAIAEATDVTVATVQGRLARGKQLLRRRLVRRGVTLSVAVGVLSTNPRAEAAAASTHLLLQTTTSAVSLATGGTLAASTAVVLLLEQGTRAMLFASLTKPMAAAAACGLAALVIAAPPTETTATTTSDGVVLTATVEGDEAETPTAAIELAPSEPASDMEPEASAPGAAAGNDSAAVVLQEVYYARDLIRARREEDPTKDDKAHLESLAASLAAAVGVEPDAIKPYTAKQALIIAADRATHKRLADQLEKMRSNDLVGEFVAEATAKGEPEALATGVAAANDPPQVTATLEVADESPAAYPVGEMLIGPNTFVPSAKLPDLRFGDMALNGRKLSDAEQNEELRKQWAAAAAADPPPTDGEPSFKELHTWHTYWEHQYDALRSQLRAMSEANERTPGSVPEKEVQTVGAEIFKARAEALRYERELKLRALKDGEPGASATGVEAAKIATTSGNESTLTSETATAAPSQEPTIEELLDQARAQVRKLAVVAKEAAKVREQASQQGSPERGRLGFGVFEKAGEQIRLNADQAILRASEILEAEMKQELARIESDGVKDASEFAERLTAVQADLGTRAAELSRLESLASLIEARIASPSVQSTHFPDFDIARFDLETLTTDPPGSEKNPRSEGVKTIEASAPAVKLSRTTKARTLAPQRVQAFEAVRVPAPSVEAPGSGTARAELVPSTAAAAAQQAAQAAAGVTEQLAAVEQAASVVREWAPGDERSRQMIAQLENAVAQMKGQLKEMQVQEARAKDVLREAPAPLPAKIEFRTSELAPALQELETLRQQNQMLRAELEAMRLQLKQSSVAFADAQAQWSQPPNWNPPQPFTALAPLDKSGRPGKYAGANQQYGYSVQQLQQQLNTVLDPSPQLDIDGDYGPKTVAAVKRLQTSKGLRPSGVADEPTRRAMGLVEVMSAPQATTIESKMWERVPVAPPVPAAPAAKSVPAAWPEFPKAAEPAKAVAPPAPPAPPVTPPPATGAANDVGANLTPEEIKQIVQGLMKDPYGPKLSEKDAQWVEAVLLDPERAAAFEKARKGNPDADATALWEAWTKHDPERKDDEIRVLDKLIRSEAADRIRTAGIALVPPKPDGARIKYAKRNSEYGWSVLQLQERLNQVLKPKQPLRVDGDYGPLTEAAVKEFQKLRELPVTGDVDARTREALGFVEPEGTLKPAAVEERAKVSSDAPQLKLGKWRHFDEPSLLYPRNWAVVAEVKDGESAPIILPNAEKPWPHFRYVRNGEPGLVWLIDPGHEMDGVGVAAGNATLNGGLEVRGRRIDARILGPGDQPGSFILLIRDVTGLLSDEEGRMIPLLTTAKQMLKEGKSSDAPAE